MGVMRNGGSLLRWASASYHDRDHAMGPQKILRGGVGDRVCIRMLPSRNLSCGEGRASSEKGLLRKQPRRGYPESGLDLVLTRSRSNMDSLPKRLLGRPD